MPIPSSPQAPLISGEIVSCGWVTDELTWTGKPFPLYGNAYLVAYFNLPVAESSIKIALPGIQWEGSPGPIQVALYNSGGTLLATTTIAASSFPTGGSSGFPAWTGQPSGAGFATLSPSSQMQPGEYYVYVNSPGSDANDFIWVLLNFYGSWVDPSAYASYNPGSGSGSPASNGYYGGSGSSCIWVKDPNNNDLTINPWGISGGIPAIIPSTTTFVAASDYQINSIVPWVSDMTYVPPYLGGPAGYAAQWTLTDLFTNRVIATASSTQYHNSHGLAGSIPMQFPQPVSLRKGHTYQTTLSETSDQYTIIMRGAQVYPASASQAGTSPYWYCEVANVDFSQYRVLDYGGVHILGQTVSGVVRDTIGADNGTDAVAVRFQAPSTGGTINAVYLRMYNGSGQTGNYPSGTSVVAQIFADNPSAPPPAEAAPTGSALATVTVDSGTIPYNGFFEVPGFNFSLTANTYYWFVWSSPSCTLAGGYGPQRCISPYRHLMQVTRNIGGSPPTWFYPGQGPTDLAWYSTLTSGAYIGSPFDTNTSVTLDSSANFVAQPFEMPSVATISAVYCGFNPGGTIIATIYPDNGSGSPDMSNTLATGSYNTAYTYFYSGFIIPLSTPMIANAGVRYWVVYSLLSGSSGANLQCYWTRPTDPPVPSGYEVQVTSNGGATWSKVTSDPQGLTCITTSIFMVGVLPEGTPGLDPFWSSYPAYPSSLDMGTILQGNGVTGYGFIDYGDFPDLPTLTTTIYGSATTANILACLKNYWLPWGFRVWPYGDMTAWPDTSVDTAWAAMSQVGCGIMAPLYGWGYQPQWYFNLPGNYPNDQEYWLISGALSPAYAYGTETGVCIDSPGIAPTIKGVYAWQVAQGATQSVGGHFARPALCRIYAFGETTNISASTAASALPALVPSYVSGLFRFEAGGETMTSQMISDYNTVRNAVRAVNSNCIFDLGMRPTEYASTSAIITGMQAVLANGVPFDAFFMDNWDSVPGQFGSTAQASIIAEAHSAGKLIVGDSSVTPSNLDAMCITDNLFTIPAGTAALVAAAGVPVMFHLNNGPTPLINGQAEHYIWCNVLTAAEQELILATFYQGQSANGYAFMSPVGWPTNVVGPPSTYWYAGAYTIGNPGSGATMNTFLANYAQNAYSSLVNFLAISDWPLSDHPINWGTEHQNSGGHNMNTYYRYTLSPFYAAQVTSTGTHVSDGSACLIWALTGGYTGSTIIPTVAQANDVNTYHRTGLTSGYPNGPGFEMYLGIANAIVEYQVLQYFMTYNPNSFARNSFRTSLLQYISGYYNSSFELTNSYPAIPGGTLQSSGGRTGVPQINFCNPDDDSSNPATQLSQACSTGATTIYVYDTFCFQVGEMIWINPNGSDQEYSTITGISPGSYFTISPGTTNAHSSGENVEGVYSAAVGPYMNATPGTVLRWLLSVVPYFSHLQLFEADTAPNQIQAQVTATPWGHFGNLFYQMPYVGGWFGYAADSPTASTRTPRLLAIDHYVSNMNTFSPFSLVSHMWGTDNGQGGGSSIFSGWNLSEFDVIYGLPDPSDATYSSDLTALETYVSNGGKLVCYVDISAGWSSALALLFGVTWTSGAPSGTTNPVVVAPTHPVLQPYAASDINAAYVGLRGNSSSTRTAGGSVTPLIADSKAGPVAWVNTYGSGTVVCLPIGYYGDGFSAGYGNSADALASGLAYLTLNSVVWLASSWTGFSVPAVYLPKYLQRTGWAQPLSYNGEGLYSGVGVHVLGTASGRKIVWLSNINGTSPTNGTTTPFNVKLSQAFFGFPASGSITDINTSDGYGGLSIPLSSSDPQLNFNLPADDWMVFYSQAAPPPPTVPWAGLIFDTG